jgi:hypothetical protein
MKKAILILVFLNLVLRAFSQEPSPSFGIKFSGFVKTDIFYDTRQTAAPNAIREGHFFLFPDSVVADMEGNDINANPSFHILNIQTRLRGDISGPDAFGAKTSGAIEAEFFGTSETDLNGFRLRHAFVKLDWDKVTLMAGQNWHPLFPAESFPGTISFNTGAPFVPFSRNPQVRLTIRAGETGLSLTAYSQRDFTSSGPDGSSNKYMKNSGMPGFNFQLKLPVGNVLTGWAGADYKRLRPELKTVANYETDVTIGSFTFFTTIKIKTKPFTASMMGIYAQNASDILMLGGYAVSETTNMARRYKRYTNVNTGSAWLDITTNGSRITAGLFTGFSKNLGASDEITGNVYGRGSNIDHLFRISPRVILTSGKLSFGAEIESTTAAYGKMQSSGKVTDTENVTNVRILLSSVYRF